MWISDANGHIETLNSQLHICFDHMSYVSKGVKNWLICNTLSHGVSLLLHPLFAHSVCSLILDGSHLHCSQSPPKVMDNVFLICIISFLRKSDIDINNSCFVLCPKDVGKSDMSITDHGAEKID